jgi:hypothetical protein
MTQSSILLAAPLPARPVVSGRKSTSRLRAGPLAGWADFRHAGSGWDTRGLGSAPVRAQIRCKDPMHLRAGCAGAGGGGAGLPVRCQHALQRGNGGTGPALTPECRGWAAGRVGIGDWRQCGRKVAERASGCVRRSVPSRRRGWPGRGPAMTCGRMCGSPQGAHAPASGMRRGWRRWGGTAGAVSARLATWERYRTVGGATDGR